MSDQNNTPRLLGEALQEAIREAVRVEIREALSENPPEEMAVVMGHLRDSPEKPKQAGGRFEPAK